MGAGSSRNATFPRVLFARRQVARHARFFRTPGNLSLAAYDGKTPDERLCWNSKCENYVMCGVPPTVSTRWAAQITTKFEELNRRAAIEDHRYCNAFRRRIRGSENFLSFNRGLKVVYFKRDVRD